MIAVVVALALSGAPSVVGEWTLFGAPFMSLKADGTCVMSGVACTYTAKSGALTFSIAGEPPESFRYSVAGDALTVTGPDGTPLTLTRAGAAPVDPLGPPATAPNAPAVSAPAVPNAAGAQPGLPKMDLKDPVAQLLLSSAWCTFSYNKTTGYSSSTRTQFANDGTFFVGARGEGYSSGAGGTFSSQHDSRSVGRWLVNKSRLWLAAPQTDPMLGPNPLVQVAFTVKKNSNGYPIIVGGDGTEYSQCQ
jgi:hypothetical protein